MPALIGNGGNKNISTLTIGTAGGNKAVQEGWIGTAGGNKSFYTAFTVSAAPSATSGFYSEFAGSFLGTTNTSTTVTTVGGSGPITYAWRRISGPTYITAGSSTGQTTAFVYSHNAGIPGTATFVCDVTRGGATKTTNPVTASFS